MKHPAAKWTLMVLGECTLCGKTQVFQTLVEDKTMQEKGYSEWVPVKCKCGSRKDLKVSVMPTHLAR